MSLWRLVIAACALIGFGCAVGELGFGNAIPALSQQASLLTGLVYLALLCHPLFKGGREHERRSPWDRGAVAVLLLLVGGVYLTLMAGPLDSAWALLEHVITPLLVLADWLFVGRNQAAVKWWHPLTWTLLPLAYLLYYLAADEQFYGSFLDPHSSGFGGTVAGFLVGVVAAGYVLLGAAKIKTAASAGGGVGAGPQQAPMGPAGPAGPMPPAGQPWQYQQPPQPQQPYVPPQPPMPPQPPAQSPMPPQPQAQPYGAQPPADPRQQIPPHPAPGQPAPPWQGGHPPYGQ